MPFMPVPTRFSSSVSFAAISYNVLPRELTEAYDADSKRAVNISLGIIFGILLPCLILSIYYCVCYKHRRNHESPNDEETFCTSVCSDLARCAMSEPGNTHGKSGSEIDHTIGGHKSQIRGNPGYRDTRVHTMSTVPNERTGRSQHRQEIPSRQRSHLQGDHDRKDRQRRTNGRSSSLGTERSPRSARKKGGKTKRPEAALSKLDITSTIPEPYMPRQRTNSPPFDRLAIHPRLAQESRPGSGGPRIPYQSYPRSRSRKGSRTRGLQSQTLSQGISSDISYPEKSHIPPRKSIASTPRPLRELGSENDITREDRILHLSESLDSEESPGYPTSYINAPASSSSARIIELMPVPLKIHQNVSAGSFRGVSGASIDSAIHDREEGTAARTHTSGGKSTEPRIELIHPGTLVDFGRSSSLNISTTLDAATDADIVEDTVTVEAVINPMICESIPTLTPSTNSLTTNANSLERRSWDSDDITLNTSVGATDSYAASNSPPIRFDSSVPSWALRRNNHLHVPVASSPARNIPTNDRPREGLPSSSTNNTLYTPEEVMDYHSSSNSSSESFLSRPYFRSLSSPVASDTGSVISMAGYLLGAGIRGRGSRDRSELNYPESISRPLTSSLESFEVGKLGNRFVPTPIPSSTLDYDVICASPSFEETTGGNIGDKSTSSFSTPLLLGLKNMNAVGVSYRPPQSLPVSASNGNSQDHPRNLITTPEITPHYHPGQLSASTIVGGSRVSDSRDQTSIPPVMITQEPRHTTVRRIVNPLPERIDTKSIRRRGVKAEESQKTRGVGYEFRGLQGADEVLIANFPMGRSKYRATVESVVDSDEEKKTVLVL